MAKRTAKKKAGATTSATSRGAKRPTVTDRGLRASGGGGRGLRLEMRAAGELRSHPGNWRSHPDAQVNAFRELLAELGQWVGYVVLNERTGRVLDGHMRKDAVPPGSLVPCLVGSWTEAQERMILATFNPVGDLAGLDAVKAAALLEGLEATLPAVSALLEGLERKVERALKALGKSLAAEASSPGGEGEGDGGGSEGAKVKPLKSVRTVMVRCADELDQMTLAQRLKAAGFKSKRAELV